MGSAYSGTSLSRLEKLKSVRSSFRLAMFRLANVPTGNLRGGNAVCPDGGERRQCAPWETSC
jgi:hypothetical protein